MIQVNNKSLFKKVVSVLMALCLMCGLLLPYAPVSVDAAAPTSYSTITAGSSAYLSISSSGSVKYFKFVPTQSGTYKFYSSSNGSSDPKGALLNASGSSLVSDDDGGNNRNFSMTYNCVANTTYYIKAYMYGNGTGSYYLNVQTISVSAGTQTGSVVEIDAAGAYPLFNSGATASSGYDRYQETNPAPHTYNNNGYDLYGGLSRSNTKRFRLGLSFLVDAVLTEQATLSIKAYDVDENRADCGHGYEYDYIYLVDETTGTSVRLDGHMSGQNNTWNNSIFRINPNCFVQGHRYHFELQMTCTGSSGCTYYAVTVRTVNLTVNGTSEPAPEQPQTGIQGADLSATISSSRLVSVGLTASAYSAANYAIEYKATYTSNGAQYGGKEYSVTIPTSASTFNTTFYLDSGAPRGTYEITVFIKDSSGNVVATRSAMASYGYSAVSYNANGGSQNLPTDTNTYSNGNTVTVKFDYVPSRYGYTFLGWSTDRNATVPMYTENGTKTFTIGSGDVTLYAVWDSATHEHSFTETSRTEPGCTTYGQIVYTCSCGETRTEPLNPAHTPGSWIVDTPASCQPGSKHKECSVCHTTVETQEIAPVAGHTEGDWIIDAAPTTTQTGSRHKECSHCHTQTTTEVMPVLAQITVDCVEAVAGHTVRVTIDIQNNPGIIGAVLSVRFDSSLTLVGVELGSAWRNLSFTRPAAFTNPCNFVWDGINGADSTNGTIIVLIFALPAGVDAGTEYSIDVSYTPGNMVNSNLESVDLSIENGSITIVEMLGDVNGDGVIDVADVVALRRYLAGGYNIVIDEKAADVDQDGQITIADIVALRRMITG